MATFQRNLMIELKIMASFCYKLRSFDLSKLFKLGFFIRNLCQDPFYLQKKLHIITTNL